MTTHRHGFGAVDLHQRHSVHGQSGADAHSDIYQS